MPVRRSALEKLLSFVNKSLNSSVGRKLVKLVTGSSAYKLLMSEINRLREIKLEEKVRSMPLPNHIAIIMDGNRRYAAEKGISKEEGYKLGSEKLREVIDWCISLGIKVVTVYAFSTENFKRDMEEVNYLLDLCSKELDRASTDPKIHQNEIKVNVIGHFDLLPEDIRKKAKNLMEATKNYSKYVLNVALAYGGRQEIVDAITKIARDVKEGKLDPKDINEETVSSYLYTKGLPDPDLVLRTSGEERISNFLLWQLAYSELYFSDVYWPAFRKKDFLEAIYTYQQRKRRFGK